MMKCDEVGRLIDRWRDGYTPAAGEAADAARHLETCGGCRASYGAIVVLLQRDAGTVAAVADPGLPPALEDRIVEGARRLPAVPSAPRVVRFPLRAGLAAAAMLVAAIGLAVGFGVRARGEQYLTVSFVIDTPEARSVAVAGDFTGWQTNGYELARRPSDGKWEIAVRLRRERAYAYCFVIDGERWVPDPGAPETVDDGFGGANSILRL